MWLGAVLGAAADKDGSGERVSTGRQCVDLGHGACVVRGTAGRAAAAASRWQGCHQPYAFGNAYKNCSGFGTGLPGTHSLLVGGTALGASGRSIHGLKIDVKTGKFSLWRLFPTFTFTFTCHLAAAIKPALPRRPLLQCFTVAALNSLAQGITWSNAVLPAGCLGVDTGEAPGGRSGLAAPMLADWPHSSSRPNRALEASSGLGP